MATTKRWSKKVNETSDAMDVAPGTFKQTDPAKIARDVERDAERSTRRNAPAYRSAMSMLTFYINRAGKNLTAKQRKVLEEAKDILRDRFGPDATRPAVRKARATASKKAPASRPRKRAKQA